MAINNRSGEKDKYCDLGETNAFAILGIFHQVTTFANLSGRVGIDLDDRNRRLSCQVSFYLSNQQGMNHSL